MLARLGNRVTEEQAQTIKAKIASVVAPVSQKQVDDARAECEATLKDIDNNLLRTASQDFLRQRRVELLEQISD